MIVELEKRLKYRMFIWFVYLVLVGVGIIFLNKYEAILFANAVVIPIVLVDEKIKEGYWFRFSDIVFTHEAIVVYLLATFVFIVVIGLIWGVVHWLL